MNSLSKPAQSTQLYTDVMYTVADFLSSQTNYNYSLDTGQVFT